jgi:hypothetical protein
MRVLIVNHDKEECGVFQFASRIYTIVSASDDVEYYHRSTGTREEYLSALQEIKPNYIIYNWHWDRMPWLKEDDVTKHPEYKHYFIYHDGSVFPVYDKYLFFGDYDPGRKSIPEEKSILLPRPLLDYWGEYPTNKVITIGSFGFATPHKRFPELVKLVNNSFQSAIINLHLARPYFGDSHGYNVLETVAKCNKENKNKRIQLNITSEFLDDNSLLEFLAGNDINVFYYSQMQNPGISSALDYALSVYRPIGITNNTTFRHIYKEEIDLEKRTIQEILNLGIKPLESYYDKWSTGEFSSEMDSLFI